MQTRGLLSSHLVHLVNPVSVLHCNEIREIKK
jgi:hypothetical protein